MTCHFCAAPIALTESQTRDADGPTHTRCHNAAYEERNAWQAECDAHAGFGDRAPRKRGAGSERVTEFEKGRVA